MIWLSLVISASSAHGAEINVDGSAVLSTFDARFASVTHDIQDFIGFNIAPWDFDWAGSAPLANMLSALAPMAVRCGGTWEDGIFWERGPRTGRYPGLKPEMFAHNLTAAQWDPFARLLTQQLKGIDLVVGLGALWRHWGDCAAPASAVCPGDIPWDSRNAASFIAHNRDAGFPVWGYELGNEPAVWNYTWGSPIVTPSQHAPDYAALRRVLATAYGGGSGGGGGGSGGGGGGGGDGGAGISLPRVVGPDTTWGSVGDELPEGGRNPIPGKGGPNYDYWNATLQASPDIDAATLHYYGLQPGLLRSWRDFVSTARDRSMCTAVAAHGADLASSPLGGKGGKGGVPLWLGEGGATYGGFGSSAKGENWLRLFGGALSYLENLGCAASNGAQIFMRQQLSNFIGAGEGTYAPQPAWWVAVLWKQLVGTTALGTSVVGDEHLVHAYGFGGKQPQPQQQHKQQPGGGGGGSHVLVVTNWDDQFGREQTITVRGCAHHAALYELTPAGPIDAGDDDAGTLLPDSTGIAINGKLAAVNADGTVPSGLLVPKTVRCEGGALHFQLAALTGAFVVLDDAA